MNWPLVVMYSFAGLGGLGTAVLVGLFVTVALGCGELGVKAGLLTTLPAWIGFGYFFLRHREVKLMLERILLTFTLIAFTLPLAGLLYAIVVWLREFDPIGEQTVVTGNALGLIFGSLLVVLGTALVAFAVGGLSLLVFLLLKFNLVHIGRFLRLEAERKVAEGRVAAVILVAALGAAGLIGARPDAAAQPPEMKTANAGPPGVWAEPFSCPMLKAASFINAAERGILAAILPLDRSKDALLGVLGLAQVREAPALRAARQRLESYVFATGNPNLRVGELSDLGDYVEGGIVTHSGELVWRLRVHKRTGTIWAAP